MLEVKYLFEDPESDRPRMEADRVPLAFVPSVSKNEGGLTMVDIEYMPGQEMISRLSGNDAKLWVYIFFGSLVLGAALAGWSCWSFFKS